MALQIQLRRGTQAEHSTFTGANGEVTVDTTNKTLRVHDGVTVGGHVVGAVEDTLTSDSASKGLSARQGKVLGDRDFGIWQNWQDVLGSRVKDVVYVNSTGKAISVIVHGQPSNLAERLILVVNNLIICDQSIDGEGNETNVIVSGIIPVGAAYYVTTTAPQTTITRWVELR